MNNMMTCFNCIHKKVCYTYFESNENFSADLCKDYLDGAMIEKKFTNSKPIYRYIELLKKNLLYGYFNSYSEVETYIEDTYKEFIKGEQK